MRKYAAATALAIALITMLTLTVSASASCGGALLCYCGVKCNIELFNTPTPNGFYERMRLCKPGAFCDMLVIPPEVRTCLAKCEAARMATQHKEAARR
jgi:hypothetical protein